MDEKLESALINSLKDFNSLSHMRENNKHVLNRLSMYEIPELSRAFNTGVVYSTLLGTVQLFFHPSEPPEYILIETEKLILKFLVDGYKV